MSTYYTVILHIRIQFNLLDSDTFNPLKLLLEDLIVHSFGVALDLVVDVLLVYFKLADVVITFFLAVLDDPFAVFLFGYLPEFAEDFGHLLLTLLDSLITLLEITLHLIDLLLAENHIIELHLLFKILLFLDQKPDLLFINFPLPLRGQICRKKGREVTVEFVDGLCKLLTFLDQYLEIIVRYLIFLVLEFELFVDCLEGNVIRMITQNVHELLTGKFVVIEQIDFYALDEESVDFIVCELRSLGIEDFDHLLCAIFCLLVDLVPDIVNEFRELVQIEDTTVISIVVLNNLDDLQRVVVRLIVSHCVYHIVHFQLPSI